MNISITVRNVSKEARDALARRARRSGRSLQEYLRLTLEDLAATPDNEEVLAGVEVRLQRTGDSISSQEIVAHRAVDRP